MVISNKIIVGKAVSIKEKISGGVINADKIIIPI